MFNLRAQLSNTGLDLTDQAFHCYFVDSLPASYDIHIMLHDDKTYDVVELCERITRHEARQKLRAAKLGTAGTLSSSDGNVALSGQQSTGRRGKGRDLKDVTCYGCGEKGHIRPFCLSKSKDDKQKPEASTSKAEPSCFLLYLF